MELLTKNYSWQVLKSKFRTLIGPDSNLVPPNATVPTVDVKVADIYVVDQGRDIAGYNAERNAIEGDFAKASASIG